MRVSFDWVQDKTNCKELPRPDMLLHARGCEEGQAHLSERMAHMLEEYTMKGSCVTPNTCAHPGTARSRQPSQLTDTQAQRRGGGPEMGIQLVWGGTPASRPQSGLHSCGTVRHCAALLPRLAPTVQPAHCPETPARPHVRSSVR